MSCFGPSLAQPSAASQDPTKHVNYELGMVLGVDDLNQEFAYHSQRDQWTARDLLGYGTVSGLQVTIRDGGPPRGPEVVVSSGAAVNPRGQLIRVAPAQCASLNQWMGARTDEIVQRRLPTADPNLFDLPLYLVLSYRTCLTDLVPIAGEPCRSEGDSTKPSRVADDFLLELTFDPPPQEEEDAVRQFVQWLRSHIVVGGTTASRTIGQFLDDIRAAATPPATSPPGGEGPLIVDTSPPTLLQVPAAQLPDYLRAVLRLWVTELRPRWRPNWLGDKHGCGGDEVLAAAGPGNQLLLAALTVPIVPPGLGSSGWTVTAANAVVLDEEARPLLLHLRLMQEWLTTAGMRGANQEGPTTAAAGVVVADGGPTDRSAVNGLRVVGVTGAGSPTVTLALTFNGYAPPPPTGGPQYLVKVLPWPGAGLTSLGVVFAGFQSDGFQLALRNGGASIAAADLSGLQLMVEVSQYP